MIQLSTVEGFIDFRKMILAEHKDKKPCIIITAGTCGQASGANDIIRIAKRHILEQNFSDKITIRITGCIGFCEIEPFVIIEPGNQLYPKLKMEDVPKIIDAAVEGKVVEDMLYKEPGTSSKCETQDDILFFKNQLRTILEKNQYLDLEV